MRIAVMGTGGLGGYYGGMLARAGHEVTCVARGAQLAAIRERGLTVRSQDLPEFTVHVAATDDPRTIGPADLVLFAVKSYDTERAIELIRPLVGPDTMVLCLQNGIDNEDKLADAFGIDGVLGGVVYLSARVDSPGVIVEGGLSGGLLFGEMSGGASARAEELLRLFRDADLAARLLPDIRPALWEKFVVIVGGGSVSALTRLSYGEMREFPETMALCRGVMEEIVAVARAAGVALPDDCVERQMNVIRTSHPSVRSSMAHDLAAGRRIEVEAFNGTVFRLGQRYEVSTPFNFAIYAALKPYEHGTPALPGVG